MQRSAGKRDGGYAQRTDSPENRQSARKDGWYEMDHRTGLYPPALGTKEGPDRHSEKSTGALSYEIIRSVETARGYMRSRRREIAIRNRPNIDPNSPITMPKPHVLDGGRWSALGGIP